jgi:FdrA protein
MVVIATLTGTAGDPQDRGLQAAMLEEAGIVIADSVRAAVLLAARAVAVPAQAPAQPAALLREAPSVINIGLRGFADDLHANGVRVVHQQWQPAAGGNERLQRLIALMQ